MGMLVLAATVLALYVGLVTLARPLPAKIKIALVIILSLGIAWLHFSIAKTQLNTVGFAAGNREANHIASYLGYGLGALGLLNVGLVFKFRRPAVIILGILITFLPALYLLSW